MGFSARFPPFPHCSGLLRLQRTQGAPLSAFLFKEPGWSP